MNYNYKANTENPKIVLESPEFYTVTPKVNGSRTFIPHENRKNIRATTSLQKEIIAQKAKRIKLLVTH